MATKADSTTKARRRAATKPTPAAAAPAAPEVEPVHWLGLGAPMVPVKLLHPGYAVGALYAAGMAVHNAEWSTLEAGVLGAGLAAGSALLPAGSKTAGAVKGFFAAAGAFAGAWLPYVADTSPYNTGALLGAGGAVVIGTPLYGLMRAAQARFEDAWRERRAKPAPIAPIEAAVVTVDANDPEAVKWQKQMEHVGLPGMTYVRREPTRCGFALYMLLPTTGKINLTACVNATARLEMSLNAKKGGLPRDCIRVEEGRDHQGRALSRLVVFHFDLRDVLSETLPMPEHHEPLSVRKAFPIGLFTDGTTAYMKIREIAWLIAGVRGRGKSNLANVIVYQLTRCYDAVLWVIDLKGGRFAKPWLQPWLRKQCARPVFDWVATTRVEAHRMVVGMLAAIEHRSNAGYHGEKIEPTRELPALICLVDEIAALLGRHSGPRKRTLGQGPTSVEFGEWFTSIAQLGRSEAVDVVVCTQRTTVTFMGPGNFKSQIEGRIGLGVTSPSDASSVFPDDRIATKLLNKLKDERTRGSALIKVGDSRISPAKCYRIEPKTGVIDRAAMLHGDIRPDLDPGTAAAVDAAVRGINLAAYAYPLDTECGYTDRWAKHRCGHLYNANLAPEWTDDMEPDDPAADVTPVMAPRPVDGPAAAAPAQRAGGTNVATIGPDDDLVAEAAALVITADFGSAAMVARKLRLRHAVAERIMSRLETLGVVGPAPEVGARPVLVANADIVAAVAAVRDGRPVTAPSTPPAEAPPAPTAGGEVPTDGPRPNRFFPPPGARPTGRAPLPPAGTPAIDTNPSADDDDQMWADLVARIKAGPDAQRQDPAGQPTDDGSGDGGDDDPVEVLVRVVRGFGPAGCSTAQLLRELRDRGVITKKNRTQIYRWLPLAGVGQKEGRIDRPAGVDGRFYAREHLRPTQ